MTPPASSPATPSPSSGPQTGPAAGAPTGPGRSGRARQKRGEGQWALGYHEPLNQNEQSKKDDNPLNVRARIEHIYSKRGFSSIDGPDLRGRFRWMGLYTQRKPGLDGGKTGALEPEELDAEYFMMRVRIDGGQLSTDQLRAIGEISTTYARGTADVTDRQNVQFHWIRIEDVPAIWEKLESVGLDTLEACGDSPRVILGSPVAGIAADEILDGTPAVEEIKRRYIGDPEYSNLPRKFKTAITGHPSQDVAPEVNDVSFVGTTHPEHGPGFDLWVGGGLSTNPMLAQRMGVWIPRRGRRRRVGRRDRDLPRLRLPPAPVAGADQVPGAGLGHREVPVAARVGLPERPLVDCESPAAPVGSGDHIGVHEQKDGRFFVGIAPTVGRVDGATLTRLAEIAELHGSRRVRTTPYQKLLVLDVEADEVDSLVRALDGIGLSAKPSNWRRNTMACTGIEFCKLAIVETKQRAADLIAELEQRFPSLDVPITVNVNGCPNACARTQVADIGLKGMLVLDSEGQQVEGYQVHLGGGLGLDPALRQEAAGPQGHQHGTRRLHHQRGDGVPRGAQGRRVVRGLGGARR